MAGRERNENNSIPSASLSLSFFSLCFLTSLAPQPLPPSHLSFLSCRVLNPFSYILPLKLFLLPPCSSFFTSLSLPTFWAVDRSFMQPRSKAKPRHHKPRPNLNRLGLDRSLSFYCVFLSRPSYFAACRWFFCLAFVFSVIPFTLERVFLHLPMDRMTRRVNFRPFRHRLLISGALLSVIVLQAEGSPSSTVTLGPATHVQS